jgi:hypothetical protein
MKRIVMQRPASVAGGPSGRFVANLPEAARPVRQTFEVGKFADLALPHDQAKCELPCLTYGVQSSVLNSLQSSTGVQNYVIECSVILGALWHMTLFAAIGVNIGRFPHNQFISRPAVHRS